MGRSRVGWTGRDGLGVRTSTGLVLRKGQSGPRGQYTCKPRLSSHSPSPPPHLGSWEGPWEAGSKSQPKARPKSRDRDILILNQDAVAGCDHTQTPGRGPGLGVPGPEVQPWLWQRRQFPSPLWASVYSCVKWRVWEHESRLLRVHDSATLCSRMWRDARERCPILMRSTNMAGAGLWAPHGQDPPLVTLLASCTWQSPEHSRCSELSGQGSRGVPPAASQLMPPVHLGPEPKKPVGRCAIYHKEQGRGLSRNSGQPMWQRLDPSPVPCPSQQGRSFPVARGGCQQGRAGRGGTPSAPFTSRVRLGLSRMMSLSTNTSASSDTWHTAVVRIMLSAFRYFSY